MQNIFQQSAGLPQENAYVLSPRMTSCTQIHEKERNQQVEAALAMRHPLNCHRKDRLLRLRTRVGVSVNYLTFRPILLLQELLTQKSSSTSGTQRSVNEAELISEAPPGAGSPAWCQGAWGHEGWPRGSVRAGCQQGRARSKNCLL